MFVAFFNKYKTYIYLVCIAGLISILTVENTIIEGARNRRRGNKQKNNNCKQTFCRKHCPQKDIECLQKYAECGNCKFTVSSMKYTKQDNTLNMYKINNNVYEKNYNDEGDDGKITNVGSNTPKMGIVPAEGAAVLDPNKDIMFHNDKLNRSYMFFPVRKSTTGMFQETGPRESNI
jgi:hypothetical protein